MADLWRRGCGYIYNTLNFIELKKERDILNYYVKL